MSTHNNKNCYDNNDKITIAAATASYDNKIVKLKILSNFNNISRVRF